MNVALSEGTWPPLDPVHSDAVARLRLALDALTNVAVVLDAQGVIVLVNQAWQHNALIDSPVSGASTPNAGLGSNYLEVTARDQDPTDGSRQALLGIRSVLSGNSDAFSLRYPCHTPTEQRWFTMRVRPVDWQGDRKSVV